MHKNRVDIDSIQIENGDELQLSAIYSEEEITSLSLSKTKEPKTLPAIPSSSKMLVHGDCSPVRQFILQDADSRQLTKDVLL